MGFERAILPVRLEALSALRPPPRLPLSRWIESNLRLPDDVSALPGDVRLWAFQRDIADAMSDLTVERVTLVKSVRVGLSTLLTATVGSFAANEPSPTCCYCRRKRIAATTWFPTWNRSLPPRPRLPDC